MDNDAGIWQLNRDHVRLYTEVQVDVQKGVQSTVHAAAIYTWNEKEGKY